MRSVFSLLSSMCTPKAIVQKAKEYNYKSVALVDKNVLGGIASFRKECEKENIKPIYGLEYDIEIDERIYASFMLAKNLEGLKNLIALSSYICTSDNKIINPDILNKYRQNNFLIFFSDDSPYTSVVDKGGDLNEVYLRMNDLFSNDYFVALSDHNIAINAKRDLKLKETLKDKKIKTIALNRTYYIDRDDTQEYAVLTCIRDKVLMDKDTPLNDGRYFMSIDEFNNLYDKEDCLNTDVLASMCNVNFEFKTSLPVFKTPNNVDSKDYLIALCKEGLKRRLNNNVTKEYVDRLNYELKIIIDMHFDNYFLIVYDFILFAKKNGIEVGPGRGSAAGSLVSYCLGITDIDPLQYGLLFERFLNPERVSMPDIDTDFPDDRRNEVVEYVKEKYGLEHVAHIITYGTLKAKQVIRDVGKVLNYSNIDLDSICKMIPYAPNVTLMDTYNNIPLFKQKIESEERFRKLFKIALKLEGLPRHESTHAAGIVFSSLPLNEVVPTTKIEDDIYSTQYTMEYLEELGLIKMDFLGLRNLGIIKEIVDDINQNENFDIKKIPLDDKKTFKLICDVNVLGVFQLESQGMMNLISKLQPKTFEDIGITIALFRPGPMENIPAYLENRNNPSKVEYLHPNLMPILKETYGIIVYQEQIMIIAQKMAGFTYGKADVLRRAMSKKKSSELEALQNEFIEGCVKNGYSRDLGIKLYELILKFANYGFNKSHSIAYAKVAYEMAYLKANYPLYFYKALLNGVIGSETKTYEYICECLSINQKVKGISINNSYDYYVINDNSIVMPFSICSDCGKIMTEKIICEREENGPFKEYIETVQRLTYRGVEKNVIENLIYSGAFDELKHSRNTMIKNLPNVLKYASAHKGEINIISVLDDAPIINEYRDDYLVAAENEKRVLGFYFSYNPIIEIKKNHHIETQSLNVISKKLGYTKGFGLVKRIKTHKTKNNEMMAFIDLNDDTGDISLVVMPNLYRNFHGLIAKDQYVYFEGNVDKEDSCLVKKLEIIKEA